MAHGKVLAHRIEMLLHQTAAEGKQQTIIQYGVLHGECVNQI